VLTQNAWEGGDLESVARRAVATHADHPGRIVLSGPPLALNARTALALTLALHELGANAIKYGALSAPEGRVRITWSVDSNRLRLEWREEGGPPVEAPERRGFGMRLIERGLAHELQGKVALTFDRSGVVCSVDAPLPDAANNLVGSPSGLFSQSEGAEG
jgi:two-component sensor histidine kinase